MEVRDQKLRLNFMRNGIIREPLNWLWESISRRINRQTKKGPEGPLIFNNLFSTTFHHKIFFKAGARQIYSLFGGDEFRSEFVFADIQRGF